MLNFIKSSSKKDNWLESQDKEICFIGRSNVGKSTLLNTLFNSKNVKVSKTPGKTRLINFFKDELNHTIVDLPGYGYAKVSHQFYDEMLKMLTEYFTQRDQLITVFLLIDSRHGFLENDLEFFNWLNSISHFNILIIFTKIDKINQKEKSQLMQKIKFLNPNSYSMVSSLNKKGIDELRNLIFAEYNKE